MLQRACVAAAVALALVAPAAIAAPIIYVESAVISDGTLNGTSINGQTLILYGRGDTADIGGGAPTFEVPLADLTFTLSGGVSGTVSGSTFAFNDPLTTLFGLSVTGVADVLDLQAPELATYALGFLEPITGTPLLSPGIAIPTSAGDLILNIASQGTLRAVPEPASAGLVGAGFIALYVIIRRRSARKRRQTLAS
ncbi:MAG: hypothetical protein U1E70_02600 [Acetobacteraceae bacterium]